MARISVASAKSKGRELQKWTGLKIARIVGEKFGKDFPVSSRPMGQSGVDIAMDEKTLKKFPFSIECKAQEQGSPHAYIRQAQENVLRGTSWLVITKKKGKEPLAILDAGVFEDCLETAQDNGREPSWTFRSEKYANVFKLDDWIPSDKYYLIYHTSDKSGEVVILDAAVFFSMFGKSPLTRTTKRKLRRKKK